jgi:hypothetical protein
MYGTASEISLWWLEFEESVVPTPVCGNVNVNVYISHETDVKQ